MVVVLHEVAMTLPFPADRPDTAARSVAYGAKYRECHALVWDRACPRVHSNLSRVATKSGKDPRSALIIDLSRAG